MIFYLLAMAIGVVLALTNQPLHAAHIIRLITFLSIVIILPLVYFLTQNLLLLAVLVMVGLSHVSLRQILRRLLPG